MSSLFDALIQESKGNWKEAISIYIALESTGTPIDQIRMHQLAARCHERNGSWREAAREHHSTGKSFLLLSESLMSANERNLEALNEFRSAILDLVSSTDLENIPDLMDDFLIALEW